MFCQFRQFCLKIGSNSQGENKMPTFLQSDIETLYRDIIRLPMEVRKELLDRVRQSLDEEEKEPEWKKWKLEDYPPGTDPWVVGLVNPKHYGKVEILGDIISPIDEQWNAMQ
ncbi:MAG: hypothetical protein LBQ50_14505 [Planctomycetaceae bacterium]|jgi:hypothetical protein|nr:hypothetical protein [Planctomycetaceae bacterium]